MCRVYYKEAVAAIIVFDVTRPATFEGVLKWKADLDSKVSGPDGSPIPCLLLANKCDEPKAGSLGEETFLDTFCEENGFIGWFYTSPKENINIEESAQFLIKKIISNKKASIRNNSASSGDANNTSGSIDDSSDYNQVISLTNKYSQPRRQCC